MDIITSDQLLGPAKFIHVHQGYLTGSWAIIWFTIVYIKQPYKTGKYMAWSYNHNKMYVKKNMPILQDVLCFLYIAATVFLL